MLESELLFPVARHFESHGLRAIAEVPVAGRRADLVAIGEDLVAVELKVSEWRQAERQAVAYQVWAPYAYVALPFARAMQAVRHRHRFEADRVGLLAVLDCDVRTFVPAGESPRLFPALTDLVRRQLTSSALSLDAFPLASGERFYGVPACSAGEQPCPPNSSSQKGNSSGRAPAARTR